MPLTRDELIQAMTRSGTGVTKVAAIGANVACSAPEALLEAINNILKAKEAK